MILHVRPINDEEGNRLSRLVKRTNNVVTHRPAQVLLHSAQGFTPPKIGELLGLTPEWVRHIIKEFNKKGFDSLRPKPAAGGGPRVFDDEIRLEMVNLALTPPRKLGYPFEKWSLRKLREAIIERGIVADISVSNVQKIMTEEMLAYQVVKTWKESKDPDFVTKKKRIDRLTRKRHNPPVVIAYDELGPIELRPLKGRHWARSGHPDRVRATYNRWGGTRQFLAAVNYHKGTWFGRLRRRKRSKEVFSFFRQLRRHYPAQQRIYLIMDNYATHTTRKIRAWAKANRVSLVFAPTNASWCNPIESHFSSIRSYAFAGTDHRDWAAVDAALQAALRWKTSHRKEMLRAREDRRHRRRRQLWRVRANVEA